MDECEEPPQVRPCKVPSSYSSMQVNGREASEPTTTIVNEVITALTQPNVIILGMYGSSDARMIKVVDNITRRVQRNGVFDVVVMATVEIKNTCWSSWSTKSPDLRRIQDELGNMLGLRLQQQTLKKRASQLRDWIKMKGKILIILYGLWGEIDLSKIGIPFGNDHDGCKIVLVAESQEVLSNQKNVPQMNICTSL
ncbi:probable disease resistance protein At5g63020 [Cajanus cajan]|uniref:probable disease resistance protein At5g63020 n=1 Tax=Cajanus cajan TaxID=3821 RepID=UPI0010FB584E|nr:probable disease resistance protein At5g63020 [Cajanus cajan]